MPGPLLTAKDIMTGAVTFPKRDFGKVTGKAKQARVFFSFSSANCPHSMPHALGRVPTSLTVVASGTSAIRTAPGVFYSDSQMPGQALNANQNFLVMSCSVTNCWCEVLIS